MILLFSASASFIMAYIPPHKRTSNDPERTLPTPDKLAPLFKKHVDIGSSKSNEWTSKLIYADRANYADRAISKWWAVGLDDDTQFPSSINLEPVSLDTILQKSGEKRLALMNSGLDTG